jgi:hypothetical protein
VLRDPSEIDVYPTETAQTPVWQAPVQLAQNRQLKNQISAQNSRLKIGY